MTGCDEFDCSMPVAGVIYDQMAPGPDTDRRRLCESHLRGDMNRRLADHRPFAVGPLAVITERTAA